MLTRCLAVGGHISSRYWSTPPRVSYVSTPFEMFNVCLGFRGTNKSAPKVKTAYLAQLVCRTKEQKETRILFPEPIANVPSYEIDKLNLKQITLQFET